MYPHRIFANKISVSLLYFKIVNSFKAAGPFEANYFYLFSVE